MSERQEDGKRSSPFSSSQRGDERWSNERSAIEVRVRGGARPKKREMRARVVKTRNERCAGGCLLLRGPRAARRTARQ